MSRLRLLSVFHVREGYLFVLCTYWCIRQDNKSVLFSLGCINYGKESQSNGGKEVFSRYVNMICWRNYSIRHDFIYVPAVFYDLHFPILYNLIIGSYVAF